MRIRHDDHEHDVYLSDDGTLETVITVDGTDVRFDDCREYCDDDMERANAFRKTTTARLTGAVCAHWRLTPASPA